MTEFLIIERIVASGEGFDVKDFRVKAYTRKREYVFARQMILKLATDLIHKMSFEKAAGFYGKDHATTNHARKTVSNLCETNVNIMLKYKDYENRCKVAIEKSKDMKAQIIDKMYSEFPPEITIRTDDGIEIVYQIKKIDGNIIGKVK